MGQSIGDIHLVGVCGVYTQPVLVGGPHLVGRGSDDARDLEQLQELLGKTLHDISARWRHMV